MKLELLILAGTLFLIANTYYEGKLLDTLKGWKKYYQIGFYAIVGIGIYLFVRKNPENGRALFSNANQFIKYLPIDSNTSDMLTPIIDLTSRNLSSNLTGGGAGVGGMAGAMMACTPQEKRMRNSGGGSTKRSVSETKKKYVAAQQGWTCDHCKCSLPAWFEVDHKVRLEYGGTNHIDNLVALCRNCHGKKTALENL
jgi:hypothetical protein